MFFNTSRRNREILSYPTHFHNVTISILFLIPFITFFSLYQSIKYKIETDLDILQLKIFHRMIITLGYDAISKNVEGLGMSPFILFSLSASAIFPACLVLLLIQDRIGRKAMASSSLLVSGVFTATAGIIIAYQKQLDPMLIAVLSIIGRFGVTIAYNSGAQYATELIPTCVRGQGVSAAHVAGYALTFFSPYILYSVSDIDISHSPKSRISSNELNFDIVFSSTISKLNLSLCLGTILQSSPILDPWYFESYRRFLLFISTGNFKSVCKLSTKPTARRMDKSLRQFFFFVSENSCRLGKFL